MKAVLAYDAASAHAITAAAASPSVNSTPVCPMHLYCMQFLPCLLWVVSSCNLLTYTHACHFAAGRVLNRFSSDTATVDDALPFTLNILLANIFGLVGTILVLCLSEPYLLLTLVPLAILYKYLQTYYRHAARELRRLNSISR